ncbi:ubiquitin carboxyl-terminal hydrolase 43 [Ixodes scapularis]
MHSSASPPSRRRQQPPGSFFTIPRWMGGARKQLQYRSLRSLEDPGGAGSTSTTTKSTGSHRPKRPSLFDQLVRRFCTPAPRHLSKGSHQQHYGPVRTGSLRDVRSRAVGGDPGDSRKDAFAARPDALKVVPAVAGLRNEGNTCFMNAVLQCLSNSDAFAEYLVSERYRGDLLRKGGAGRSTSGSGGRVTEQLAQVIAALWRGRADADVSARFKSVVEKHASQYQGSEQHDAQEFLMWLLDKVHEDLDAGDDGATGKRSHKRPKAAAERFGSSRNARGSVPSSLPGEWQPRSPHPAPPASRWQGSRVASLFGGQLRLRLTCPRCGRQSITFDPFLCLSLPIPVPQQWLCRLSFVPRNAPPVKLGFHLDCSATMEQVRQRVASECHVPADQLLLLEETKEGYGNLFSGDEPASGVPPGARLVALELPSAKVTATTPKDALLLLLCRSRLGSSGPCLGATRAVWVPREVSYNELKSKVVESLPSAGRSSLKDQGLENGFEVLAWDAQRTLPTDVDHPLFLEFVDHVLEAFRDVTPVPLLRLLLRWEPRAADRLFLAEDSIAEEGADVSLEQESAPSVSLSDCLDFYFTEEKLEPDEAWLCPQCESRQQGVAQLALSSCPDILVVHLKRFHQSGRHHGKLATRVEVTQNDLDLGPHLCQQGSGLRGAKYDLYALCSHHGAGLQGGHYTACCKNPVDGNWYLFDDARVRPATPEDLMARDAYLLFYQRQNPDDRKIGSGSSLGTTTSGHWFSRAPPLSSSRSHEQLLERSPVRRRETGSSPVRAGTPPALPPPPTSYSVLPGGCSPSAGDGSPGSPAAPVRTNSLSRGEPQDTTPRASGPQVSVCEMASCVMRDGVMRDGVMRDGVMRDGVMRDGVVRNGVMRNGVMRDGIMRDITVRDASLLPNMSQDKPTVEQCSPGDAGAEAQQPTHKEAFWTVTSV